MSVRTVSSWAALACLALSPLSFAAPAPRRGSDLGDQLQDLRARIKQEAAKSESGLSAAQRSALKAQVAEAAPEVSRVRAELRTLAKRLRVTARPGAADVLASDRVTLLLLMDQSAEDLLAAFMKLETDDSTQKGDAEDAIRALCERLVKAHTRIILNASATPTPHLSPRPSHD